jgi:hypothetical protein
VIKEDPEIAFRFCNHRSTSFLAAVRWFKNPKKISPL